MFCRFDMSVDYTLYSNRWLKSVAVMFHYLKIS